MSRQDLLGKKPNAEAGRRGKTNKRRFEKERQWIMIEGRKKCQERNQDTEEKKMEKEEERKED